MRKQTGIPRTIPGVLDGLVNGDLVELPLNVIGASSSDEFVTRFDPKEFTGGRIPWLERPKFIAIVASATLANMLARKATGRVDGFIVEGPTAGGHNAPPRGKTTMNTRGEPVYGHRDEVDLDAIAALGRSFWLAGSYGSPEQVAAALEKGATGVQVGTAFVFCEESGLRSDIKAQVLDMCRAGDLDVVSYRPTRVTNGISVQSTANGRVALGGLGLRATRTSLRLGISTASLSPERRYDWLAMPR